eukprot:5512754-Pleurochrysis_carterae.AAC.1
MFFEQVLLYADQIGHSGVILKKNAILRHKQSGHFSRFLAALKPLFRFQVVEAIGVMHSRVIERSTDVECMLAMCRNPRYFEPTIPVPGSFVPQKIAPSFCFGTPHAV